MSASLVGSEMCIRDRSSTLQVDWIRPITPPQCFERQRQSSSEKMRHLPVCLLYTSDAADDM
eukprot:406004-Alexandrium_andersonii.AAC.1